MKSGDYAVEVKKIVGGGFVVKKNDGTKTLIKYDPDDELSPGENMLWELINHFNLRGNDFSPECLFVVRGMGDEYTLKEDEKIVKKYYLQVASKKNKKKRAKSPLK